MCFLFFQKAPLTHDPEFPCFIGTKGHIFQVEEPILKQISNLGVWCFFYNMAGLHWMCHFDEILCPQSLFAKGDNITGVALTFVTITR